MYGQQESVFGSSHHNRHEDRPKWGKRFIQSQQKTLVRRHPELFAALNMVKDKGLSDQELYSQPLTFSRDRFLTNGLTDGAADRPRGIT